jgi:hypothetical protein
MLSRVEVFVNIFRIVALPRTLTNATYHQKSIDSRSFILQGNI